MLVNVRLYGQMGKEFGKEWKLAIRTPREALGLIEANTGRLFNWMRTNIHKYSTYKVLCIFKNGKREYLNQDTFVTAHNIQEVRFTPVIQGAGGGIGKIIAGVALMATSFFGAGPFAFQAGLTLAMGGVTQLLTPKVKTNDGSNKSSHYFQGATNTAEQGSVVPLIYGRCKVGSQVVSLKLTVGESAVFVGTNGTNGTKKFLNGSSNG